MTLPFVHLRVRTEYSLGDAFGRVDDVLQRVQMTQTEPVACITDGGTWGHPTWRAACAAKSLTPIYGVEIAVVANPTDRAKQPGAKVVFLAKNQDGLHALYRLVAKASSNFYFTSRLGYRDVQDAVTVDGNMVVLAGAGARLDLLPPSSGVYLMLSPTTPEWNAKIARERLYETVLVADARYPTVEDRPYYEVHAGTYKRQSATVPLHLPTLAELRRMVPSADDDSVLNTARIAAEIIGNAVELPKVGTIKFDRANDTVRHNALDGAVHRGLADRDGFWQRAEYEQRFEHELRIITEKGFADYFVLVADLVRFAKKRMLVGPGRGSSAGSLVCYLLGITDVDPLPHGLLFERFIDVTRTDWPDIDIDFPHTTRDEVFIYLTKQYGERYVARLGSIIKYKPDSALNKVCLTLDIPSWKVRPFQDRIPPKPDGDTAFDAIETALLTDPLGQRIVEEYPGLLAATRLEGHASTTGKHASGVVVADRPLDEVCGLGPDRVCMVDKRQAEQIGMLKVDVLGLTTLSVIDDCLKQIEESRAWLLSRPLDDPLTYDVFRQERTAGIFQFEGKTQGGLLKRMSVDTFADIVALGALSRPGPLDAGATETYVNRRMGREQTRSVHPIYDRITQETYGIIAYQEQMMAMLREVGCFDWPAVSKLRKAINQKMGADWFDAYRDQFVVGAETVGMLAETAHRVWDNIITFGQYAFNKSHSVAYGMISYWCAYLKAHHPLEFACAVLRNPKDDEAAIKALRDLVREGYAFTPCDAERSTMTWEVHDGHLLGGLTTVKGIGPALAREVLACRAANQPLRDVLLAKLTNPVTPFDDIFEAERRFGAMYKEPSKYKIVSGPLSKIEDVDGPGTYVILGKVREIEVKEKEKYGTMRKYVRIRVADDSDDMWVRINTKEFDAIGHPFLLPDAIGKWCVFKGDIYDTQFRIINVEKVRWLDPKPA